MAHRNSESRSVLSPSIIAPCLLAISLTLPLASSTFAGEKETERLNESRAVLGEMAGMKEGAPRPTPARAKCGIVIAPRWRGRLAHTQRRTKMAPICQAGPS